MTDKERIEILKKVKKLISSEQEHFICNAISEVLETHYNRNYLDDTKKVMKRAKTLFPELSKHKPKMKIGNAWWRYWEKEIRIKVLNSMIKEIKAKSND